MSKTFAPILLGIILGWLVIMSLSTLTNDRKVAYQTTTTKRLPALADFSTIAKKPTHSVFSFEKTKNDAFNSFVEKISNRQGTFGIYIKNPANQEELTYNSEAIFYAASLYKLPLAIAVEKAIEEEIINKNTQLPYFPEDFASGTGTYDYNVNEAYSVELLQERLLKDSDNIAQNILFRSLDNTLLRDAYTSNSIYSTKSNFFDLNLATPKEIAGYFEMLVNPNRIYLKGSSKTELLSMMFETKFDDRINLGLDSNVVFSHKIGSWGLTGSWHDCGVAYEYEQPLIVCLMSEETTYETFLEISKLVGEFVSQYRN